MKTTPLIGVVISILFILQPCDTSEMVLNKKTATVEILIAYDNAFAALLNNKEETIRKFWNNHMWEVHARFQTLVSTSIEIRVVGVIAFDGKQVDHFSGNTFPFNFLRSFAEWLYQKSNSIPNFDMTLLALGTQIKQSKERWTNTGGICKIDHDLKLRLSVAVVKYHPESLYFPLSLAQGIGEVLGTRADEYTAKSCGNQDFPFLRGGPQEIGRFFYSRCADEAIAVQLEQKTSECVFHHDPEASNLLDLPNLPTLNEQCKKQSNEPKLYAANIKSRCVAAPCRLNLYSIGVSSYGFKTLGYIFPQEGSPCELNSNCFRGRCIPRGSRIQSVNLGTCIESNNSFVANDWAVMAQCFQITTVKMLRIEENKSLRWRFMSMFSKPYSTATHDKCLVVEKTTMTIKFTGCQATDNEYWEINPANLQLTVFKMMHIVTKSCVAAESDTGLVSAMDCDSNDTSLLWQVDEGKDLSLLFPGKFASKESSSCGICFTCWLRKLFR